MTGLTKSMLLLSAFAPMLAGCFGSDSDDDDDGDGVVYVAMGNSLTSGFQNSGLRADWQKASYPALIARQLGIGDFQLPLIDSPGIGTRRIGGKPATPLYQEGFRAIAARPLNVTSTAQLLSNRTLARPYNNLGIPGATTLDILRAYDSTTAQAPGNGFFNIVLRGGLFQNATMLRQAVHLKPTIITLWIGNNDILGGVTEGTIVPGVTVTPAATYGVLMDRILDTLLKETEAHIFLANIPSITTIPYVTTVPRFVFNPETFAPVPGPVPFLTREDSVRYLLLSAFGQISQGVGIPDTLEGTGDSLAGNYTLTESEANLAEGIVNGYNAYLEKKAEDNDKRITLVDVNSLLVRLADEDITGLSSKFTFIDSAKTAFSLDGIHPNMKGYRQVANLFLDAINGALGTEYQKVSVP